MTQQQPAPLPPPTIHDVFKIYKNGVQEQALHPLNYTLKSCGTRDLALSKPLSPQTGFWLDPSSEQSKPMRWILQVTSDAAGAVSARLAADAAGAQYAMARTIGYVNNHDGTGAVVVVRIYAAVRPHGAPTWSFPDWEWLLWLVFQPPLPAGTSGDALTNYDAAAGTIDFGGGANKKTHPIVYRAIVKAGHPTASVGNISFVAASDAIAGLAIPNAVATGAVYDSSIPSERDRLIADILARLQTAPTVQKLALDPHPDLHGVPDDLYRQIEAAVNSGKRHLILYGPPGTGKTTLAEYVAREIGEQIDGSPTYTMLTASSAWTSQDLVGGYQPLGPGQIAFVPGAMLRDFERPVVIDELNRCPIDKVIGPLFSVLSGQSTTLPYRRDVTRADSDFFVILGSDKQGKAAHEFAPGSGWRLICTLNTYDKTQLGQISYALSRRFAWIRVGVPEDLPTFLVSMAPRLGLAAPSPGATHPIAKTWQAVNSVREIGAAPVIDMVRVLSELDPTADIFLTPSPQQIESFLAAFRMTILPLMDGIAVAEANDLAQGVAKAWSASSDVAERLGRDCREFAA